METIKEKAKAYSLEAKENAVFGYDEEDLEKGFLAGSSYVLDAIEKLTNNQNWCAFPKQSHKELKELFEQLKK